MSKKRKKRTISPSEKALREKLIAQGYGKRYSTQGSFHLISQIDFTEKKVIDSVNPNRFNINGYANRGNIQNVGTI